MYVYIYMYTHIHVYTCTCIYMYMYTVHIYKYLFPPPFLLFLSPFSLPSLPSLPPPPPLPPSFPLSQLQYLALGLSDSFDESEPPAMNGTLKNGEGGEEEEEEESGRRDVVEPMFDDPKYVSSSWAQVTLLKVLYIICVVHTCMVQYMYMYM